MDEHIKINYHAMERFAERFPKKADRFAELWEKATIYKGWMNNTRYLCELQKRYGTQSISQARIAEDVVFIIRRDSKQRLEVITCVPVHEFTDHRTVPQRNGRR